MLSSDTAYQSFKRGSENTIRSVSTASARTPLKDSRIDIFGDLVEAIRPSDCYVANGEQKIWIEEATHRAQRFLGLFLRLETGAWTNSRSAHRTFAEREIAKQLVASFLELNRGTNGSVISCRTSVQKILGELISLFSPAFFQVVLKTELDQMKMTARQNRALILTIVELILYLVQEGLPSNYVGEIRLTLKTDEQAGATLVVAVGSRGFSDFSHNLSATIVCGLCSILNGEMLVRCAGEAGTSVEVRFPYKPRS